jgi:hypothetical protein
MRRYTHIRHPAANIRVLDSPTPTVFVIMWRLAAILVIILSEIDVEITLIPSDLFVHPIWETEDVGRP